MSEYKAMPWMQRRREHPVRQLGVEHDEALYLYGEFVAFVLLWRPEDYKNGLVDRCGVCIETSRLAQAYDQTADPRCPGCFGTTFEDGARAILWRPALIADTDPETNTEKVGQVTRDRVSVETTSDVQAHNGDFFVRRDGSRWRLSDSDSLILHTGFGMESSGTTGAAMTAQREDDSSPIYVAPPDKDQIMFFVDELTELRHLPPNTLSLDVINGPLRV